MSSRRLRISRSGLITTIAVVVGLGVSGCAPGQTPEGSPSPSGPVSDEEFGRIVSECLVDAGWDAEAGVDGSVSVPEGIPAAQLDQYNADTAECMKGFGPVRALTAAEKKTYFEQLEDVAACLEDKGYAVAQKPSFQSFAETDVGNWDPYGALEGAEQQQATIDCVQPTPIQ